MEREVRAFAKGRTHCKMPCVTRLCRNKNIIKINYVQTLANRARFPALEMERNQK